MQVTYNVEYVSKDRTFCFHWLLSTIFIYSWSYNTNYNFKILVDFGLYYNTLCWVEVNATILTPLKYLVKQRLKFDFKTSYKYYIICKTWTIVINRFNIYIGVSIFTYKWKTVIDIDTECSNKRNESTFLFTKSISQDTYQWENVVITWLCLTKFILVVDINCIIF